VLLLDLGCDPGAPRIEAGTGKRVP
jgi:hypothetical protein